MPAVGDHYRGTEAGEDGTVHRVVGENDEVTLLRVTDHEGRRVYSGETRRVTRGDLENEFEPASDPDAGFTPWRTTRNALQGLYWDVRRFFP